MKNHILQQVPTLLSP